MVDEVKRLLAEGQLSQRKIAKLTGVSRGSVGAIASGRRADHPRRPALGEDDDYPSGPPERCPECGAIVYPPCRLCALRKLLATKRIPQRPERPLGPIELDLNDNHHARYEQVRGRSGRERRDDPPRQVQHDFSGAKP